MLKTYLIIGLSIISLAISAAEVKMPDLLAIGDAQLGAGLVATCSACHGAEGQSPNSDWPSLAGQNQRYISDQLKYFNKAIEKMP